METQIRQEATVRTVHQDRRTFNTLQFSDFNEALKNLIAGDDVLAYSNCGRYLMKVYSVDNDCITCHDAVGIVQFRKNNVWSKNGLERVLYN